LWYYLRQREEITRILNANKIVKNFEIKIRRKDGKILTCLWSGQIIEINGEKYIIASVIDNTKNKKIETELINARKLAEENDKFNSFVLDLYIKSETSDNNTIIKKSLEKAVEFTESEIGFFHFIGENKETFEFYNWSTNTMNTFQITEDELDLTSLKSEICLECLKEKKPYIVNDCFSIINKKALSDDHIIINKLICVPILEGEKNIAILGVANKKDDYLDKDVELLNRLCNNFWNIVRRKNAENLSRKLNKAVESSKASVVITDINGNIEYANLYFSESTGYSKEEYLGKNSNFLKSGFNNENFYKNLWQTILSGKTWEGEFQNKKKNGSLYSEHAIISPIFDLNNEITHFVAVKYDTDNNHK